MTKFEIIEELTIKSESDFEVLQEILEKELAIDGIRTAVTIWRIKSE